METLAVRCRGHFGGCFTEMSRNPEKMRDAHETREEKSAFPSDAQTKKKRDKVGKPLASPKNAVFPPHISCASRMFAGPCSSSYAKKEPGPHRAKKNSAGITKKNEEKIESLSFFFWFSSRDRPSSRRQAPDGRGSAEETNARAGGPPRAIQCDPPRRSAKREPPRPNRHRRRRARR